ncbi:MAG: hypothetical protein EOP47_05805 [Sphingobacteriaceae bacterium]|nr:MAG: hypothetical protein EOP47_05805 [Sphingobacteriaceae bacterium]
MKTDTYTKIVLTVIAIVLTLNLIKGSSTPAMADGKHFATVPVNADGTINVNIKNASTMEVKITDVSPFAFQYARPIPVKVNN